MTPCYGAIYSLLSTLCNSDRPTTFLIGSVTLQLQPLRDGSSWPPQVLSGSLARPLARLSVTAP